MATLRKNLEDSEKAAQEAEEELNAVNRKAEVVKFYFMTKFLFCDFFLIYK